MLGIHDEHCRLGKIANNLEKAGEDGEETTGFTIPVSELMLGAEEVNEFIEDPHADRWMFNTRLKGAKEPISDKIEPFKLKEDFEGAVVTLILPGDRELEFEDCKVKDVQLQPMKGGTVHVTCKLYLRPGMGKENLLLQEHQNREVRISIADANVATTKKSSQKDLEFGDAADAEDSGAAAPMAH